MSENDRHEHGEGCDCGCDEEFETMTLTMEDDTEVECAVLGVFEVEDKEYIALLPMDDDSVLIYEYKEDGDNVELGLIESDEEFEMVSAAFGELYGDDEDCQED